MKHSLAVLCVGSLILTQTAASMTNKSNPVLRKKLVGAIESADLKTIKEIFSSRTNPISPQSALLIAKNKLQRAQAIVDYLEQKRGIISAAPINIPVPAKTPVRIIPSKSPVPRPLAAQHLIHRASVAQTIRKPRPVVVPGSISKIPKKVPARRRAAITPKDRAALILIQPHTAETLALEKELLKNLDAEKCRGKFTVNAEGFPVSISNRDALACMIAGLKHVILLNGDDPEIEKLNKLRTKYTIQELRYKPRVAEPYASDLIFTFWYTPQGEDKAKLLRDYYKEVSEQKRQHNHYLEGFLLGYNEKKIEDYYRQLNKKPKLFGRNNFQQDKKKALQWLKEHTLRS